MEGRSQCRGPRGRASWIVPGASVVAILLSVVAPGAVAGESAERPSDFALETVVATVDGEPLTLGELMIRFANLPQPIRDSYAARPGGLGDFLADAVANLVVAREAEALGVEADPLYEILMGIRREEVLRDLYARRNVLRPIDPATVEARYRETLEPRFQREARARVRHILVTPVAEASSPGDPHDAIGAEAARAKIERARGRLVAGEDFAAVARELSEGASAANGGDLGWVVHGQLVPELSKLAFTLEIGAVSSVVESELGLHVLQVVDRRPAGAVPLELVAELLYQELVGERAAELIRRAGEDRDALVEAHDVELYPERLPW